MTAPTSEHIALNATRISSAERKDMSRGLGLDMSSEAVTGRLDIVDELRELALELANAKRLGPVNSVQPSSRHDT